MTEHFNELAPAEDEILALVAEECAEIIQAITKIQRHGLESFNPFDAGAGNNRLLFAKEVGHLRHALKLAWDAGLLNDAIAETCQKQKAQSIGRWLHHQPSPSARASVGRDTKEEGR